jgi:hypothetical protein
MIMRAVEGASSENQSTPQPVKVVDIQMSFMSMVVFMVKWALAAIPAAIILLLAGGMTLAALAGLGAR